MKKKFVTAIMVIMFPVYAISSPDIYDIKKGEPSPIDGTVLTKEAISKILAEKKNVEEKHKLEIDYLKMRTDEKLKSEKKIHEIEVEAFEKKNKSIIDIKDKELERLNKIALKNENTSRWWFVGGVVSGILVTVGLFFATSYAIKSQ